MRNGLYTYLIIEDHKTYFDQNKKTYRAVFLVKDLFWWILFLNRGCFFKINSRVPFQNTFSGLDARVGYRHTDLHTFSKNRFFSSRDPKTDNSTD